MAAVRFIAVEDPGKVTVGQLGEAARRIDASLAVIIEGNAPAHLVRPNDVPEEAEESEPIASYSHRLTRLQILDPERTTLEAVAFEPEYAVIMHRNTPFLVPAARRLTTPRDVVELLDTAGTVTFGPDIRLPGELADIRLPGELPPPPPPDRVCYCPRGHQIRNPTDLTCPHDQLPLMC